MKKLGYQDFAVLRRPLESGRQSPSSLAANLILAVFLQVIIHLAFYYLADSTNYPSIHQIRDVHLLATISICVLSILFAIPPVYKRLGAIQYLVSIIVSQNLFCIYPYIGGLILLGRNSQATKDFLANFTTITLEIGLLLFILTFIRFIFLLNKGKYRKGGKKDQLRGTFETDSYLPFVIAGGVGLVFVMQYVIRSTGIEDFGDFFFAMLLFAAFYTMIFVLPEQLVILYCKFRFKSFTFNERGYLLDEDDRKRIKA
ncbi:hypothetical protein [Bacillus sp. MUM 13]|uniref:hypothetical protein n=1 Tax=Bacillus sp. MUM 13 TaxID=1678001 RepID=UPI0008F5D4A3|nr:hypothetical protein [Bacillus sp. MUM 13]OIK13883.1 hypothetical protein BIV59_04235 [Bacillus sp. MUM 13]